MPLQRTAWWLTVPAHAKSCVAPSDGARFGASHRRRDRAGRRSVPAKPRMVPTRFRDRVRKNGTIDTAPPVRVDTLGSSNQGHRARGSGLMVFHTVISRRRFLAGSAAALAIVPTLLAVGSVTAQSTDTRVINTNGVRLRSGPGLGFQVYGPLGSAWRSPSWDRPAPSTATPGARSGSSRRAPKGSSPASSCRHPGRADSRSEP